MTILVLPINDQLISIATGRATGLNALNTLLAMTEEMAWHINELKETSFKHAPFQETPPGDPEPQPPEPPEPPEPRKKIKIRLRDGKEREIQHMISTSYWSADGKPISAEEFLQNLFGVLPAFFKNEEELRAIWSDPITRKAFLDKIAGVGFGREELITMQKLIEAEDCDLFDVLEYGSYARPKITRLNRVIKAKDLIFLGLDDKHKDFLDFVLAKYIESGVDQLDQEKLPSLLMLKYHAISDATEHLGGVEMIRSTFLSFQKHLYAVGAG
ncbi:MAG: type I restriction-modification enzyme R subunit C-terminal domain-containing protein [Bacteroidota bacterium]